MYKRQIQEAEPVLRESDIVSVNLCSAKSSELNIDGNPNGFNSQQLCALMRYAGLSYNLKVIGLFNIPNDITGNDVASIEHVISRRLKYYEENKPDLILIDGGRTQLNFTNKILKNFDMEKILVLGIAKDY